MLKPLRDRIVVKIDERQEKSEGGIFIPSTALGRASRTGRVVALGKGKVKKDRSFQPINDIAIGNRILYSSGELSGVKILHEGEEYLVLREKEVLGIIEE